MVMVMVIVMVMVMQGDAHTFFLSQPVLLSRHSLIDTCHPILMSDTIKIGITTGK